MDEKQFKDLYDSLLALAENLPSYNGSYSQQKLSNIFSEYKQILDQVSSINDFYRKNTSGHYMELTDIDYKIRKSSQARSQKQKDDYFREARSHLKDDIETLANLVKRPQDFDEREE